MGYSIPTKKSIAGRQFGNRTYTPPSSYWVAFATALPASDGTGGTYLAITRQELVNDTTTFPLNGSGYPTNGAEYLATTPTGGGTVIAVVLMSAVTGGVAIAVSNAISKTYAAGDEIKIAASSLEFR